MNDNDEFAVYMAYLRGVREGLHMAGTNLKYLYDDFMPSANEPMDLELGEIYREHLKSIYKNLMRNGVTLS